jgi:hypothetical protein
MATLSICEFDTLAITDYSIPDFGKLNANTRYQTVPISAVSTGSALFASTTKFIRLTADASCSFVYTPPGSGSIAATTSTAYLPGNQHAEYLGVDPDGFISVITNS